MEGTIVSEDSLPRPPLLLPTHLEVTLAPRPLLTCFTGLGWGRGHISYGAGLMLKQTSWAHTAALGEWGAYLGHGGNTYGFLSEQVRAIILHPPPPTVHPVPHPGIRRSLAHTASLGEWGAYLGHGGNKPVPAGKRKLERGHFSHSNCISPASPGRRLIEEIEFSLRLERAYTYRFLSEQVRSIIPLPPFPPREGTLHPCTPRPPPGYRASTLATRGFRSGHGGLGPPAIPLTIPPVRRPTPLPPPLSLPVSISRRLCACVHAVRYRF
jgi:hypothetical protein